MSFLTFSRGGKFRFRSSRICRSPSRRNRRRPNNGDHNTLSHLIFSFLLSLRAAIHPRMQRGNVIAPEIWAPNIQSLEEGVPNCEHLLKTNANAPKTDRTAHAGRAIATKRKSETLCKSMPRPAAHGTGRRKPINRTKFKIAVPTLMFEKSMVTGMRMTIQAIPTISIVSGK